MAPEVVGVELEENSEILGEPEEWDGGISYKEAVDFDYFDNLTRPQQYSYIHNKMLDRAIIPNFHMVNFLIDSTLKKVDLSKANIDSYLDQNLTTISKMERDAQLNRHAITRVRPFLQNKTYDLENPSPFSGIIKPTNNFFDLFD